MNDTELRQNINAVLKKHNPASLTELGRLLGWNKISGSQTQRIRRMLPGLEEMLNKNIVLKELEKSSTTPVKIIKKAMKKHVKHEDGNPYRPGSNYALTYSCLVKMGSKKPVSRKDLIKEVCKLSGKDEKHAGYDLAVILSPTIEGKYHKSATRPSLTYYVDRLENGMVQWRAR